VGAVNLTVYEASLLSGQAFPVEDLLKSLPDVPDQDAEAEATEALVVFMHAEASDGKEERKSSVMRQALKHIKWLANKRGLKNIVLHSFAHLGGDASPPAAAALIAELAERLEEGGYNARTTPFGYFCEWDLLPSLIFRLHFSIES
jgi:hypothetical protein